MTDDRVSTHLSKSQLWGIPYRSFSYKITSLAFGGYLEWTDSLSTKNTQDWDEIPDRTKLSYASYYSGVQLCRNPVMGLLLLFSANVTENNEALSLLSYRHLCSAQVHIKHFSIWIWTCPRHYYKTPWTSRFLWHCQTKNCWALPQVHSIRMEKKIIANSFSEMLW